MNSIDQSAAIPGSPGFFALEQLMQTLQGVRRMVVLTGAGCSTGSGLPEYRDANGEWKHARPVMHQDFVNSAATRKRYWARSYAGWPSFSSAKPNAAHKALARMEKAGMIRYLITQNVDRLHQLAGSREVVDIHGRLDRVVCLDCNAVIERKDLQDRLVCSNPGFVAGPGTTRPDGDTQIADGFEERFQVPSCLECSGILKPDVVFFGDNVPRSRVDFAMKQLASADFLLIVGSSLMVYSGYRFVRTAQRLEIPIAILNVGRTRADDEVDLKVPLPCEPALTRLADLFASSVA